MYVCMCMMCMYVCMTMKNMRTESMRVHCLKGVLPRNLCVCVYVYLYVSVYMHVCIRNTHE